MFTDRSTGGRTDDVQTTEDARLIAISPEPFGQGIKFPFLSHGLELVLFSNGALAGCFSLSANILIALTL